MRQWSRELSSDSFKHVEACPSATGSARMPIIQIFFALVAGLLFAFAQPALADSGRLQGASQNNAFGALADYARGLDAASDRSADIKVAEADDFFTFMKEHNGDQPPPAATPAPKIAPKAPVKGAYKAAPGAVATIVGSQVCLGCHSAQAALFDKTLMGRIAKQGKLSCETCHGPGSEHVRAGGGRGVGGIISFRTDDLSRSAEENNGICLGCHDKGDRTMWGGSVHEERNLMCTNCHSVMQNVSRKFNLRTAWEPDTCFQCHKDRRAQIFRSSHMPVREGKIVCSDCHNPHGTITESLLREDSINDTCYKCHAEKRGPFLFEHEPVRENCDNCHDPHGSINEYSLKVARPRLCNECHNLMDNNAGMQSNHGMGQACENCHVAIHGSNSPGGSLLFR